MAASGTDSNAFGALGLAIWEVATIKNRVIRERGGVISVVPTFSPATQSIGFAAQIRF